MAWPQIVIIGLLVFTGTWKLFCHGQLIRVSFGGWIIDASILIGLLWAGGFWS